MFALSEADEEGYLTLNVKDNSSKKVLTAEHKYTPVEAGEWLLLFLRGLAFDNDPFKMIQLDSPCFPSLVFTIDSLKKVQVRRQVHGMFELTRAAWKNNYICNFDNKLEYNGWATL